MRDKIQCYYLTDDEYQTVCIVLGRMVFREIPRDMSPTYRHTLKQQRRRAKLALNAITSYRRQEMRRKQTAKKTIDKALGRP